MEQMNYKNTNIPLNITVNLANLVVTNEVNIFIVRNLLKYVLYQRHQVPVQVEALEKEWFQSEEEQRVDQCKSAGKGLGYIMGHSMGHNLGQGPVSYHGTPGVNGVEKLSIAVAHKMRIQQSKDRQMKLKQERLRNKYRSKVAQFCHSYSALCKALEEELCRGGVSAVRFSVGSSYITSKEVYTIHLPITAKAPTPVLPVQQRKIMLHLFRDFIMCDALTKLVNKPCGLTKIWILVQKPRTQVTTQTVGTIQDRYIEDRAGDGVSGVDTGVVRGVNGVSVVEFNGLDVGGVRVNVLNKVGVCKVNSVSDLQWLPRPNYSLSRQVKQINIRLVADLHNSTSQGIAFVHSTSCVDTKDTQRGRLLPSLAKRCRMSGGEATENSRCKNDDTIGELESFEMTSLNNSESATPAENELFAKPGLATPVPRILKVPQPHNQHHCFTTPKPSTDHTIVDMMETPLTRICAYTGSGCKDRISEINETCETSINDNTHRSSGSSSRAILCTPVNRLNCSLVANETPLQACIKRLPQLMVETPFLLVRRAPCASLLTDDNVVHEIIGNSEKKLHESVNVRQSLEFDSVMCGNSSSECMSVDMVETPVVKSYKCGIKINYTPARLASKSVDMIETPIVTSRTMYSLSTKSFACNTLENTSDAIPCEQTLNTKTHPKVNARDICSHNSQSKEQHIQTQSGSSAQSIEVQSLMWYQLSMPLVGFKEKPVSKVKTNDFC